MQASTSASAFGQHIPYGKVDSAPIPSGYHLQFGEALQTASEHMITRWATPSVAYKLPIPHLRRFLSHISLSYSELRGHLQTLIENSRSSILAGLSNDTEMPDDLLRRLVAANILEKDPNKKLTDEELLSNVFVSHMQLLLLFSHI